MADRDPSMIRIEVVYGVPDRQGLVTVELPSGSTVEQAIAALSSIAATPSASIAQTVQFRTPSTSTVCRVLAVEYG